jgi:uncharacterized protein YacL
MKIYFLTFYSLGILVLLPLSAFACAGNTEKILALSIGIFIALLLPSLFLHFALNKQWLVALIPLYLAAIAIVFLVTTNYVQMRTQERAIQECLAECGEREGTCFCYPAC